MIPQMPDTTSSAHHILNIIGQSCLATVVDKPPSGCVNVLALRRHPSVVCRVCDHGLNLHHKLQNKKLS